MSPLITDACRVSSLPPLCSDRSQVEMERHEDLVDQWTLLQWERSAVLNPRAGSGLPGAPTKWDLEPGVEERVPTLFLDLNGGWGVVEWGGAVKCAVWGGV